MSLKQIAFVIFVVTGILVFCLFYQSAKEVQTGMEQSTISSDLSDELLNMSPLEVYQVTMKNAWPEIKILSLFLVVMLVTGIMAARFEIVSSIASNALNGMYNSIVARRGEKLAVIEERKRIQSLVRVRDEDMSGLRSTINKLEKRAKK